ncbi:MAG: TolC family protein [Lachnospiraceae bacterium]
MNMWKRILPFSLAAVMASATPFAAMAAELSDYDEATQARLQDNVMEYDELPALIAVYNPTIKSINTTVDDQLASLEGNIDDLNTNAGKLYWEADDYKNAGNQQAYMLYKATADQVRAAAKAYQEGLDKAKSHSATRSIRSAEYGLTSAVQMLMINYQSLEAQREMVAKSKELAEAAYQSTQTQIALGMATEADLLNAQKAVEQATNGLITIESNLTMIKQNLCMMTGWSYDANPEIRRIPTMDLGRINNINLEEDKQKAIGNNAQLISQRSGSSAGSTMRERDSRKRNIDEAEQQLCIELEQQYLAIQQKKIAYEAANAAFASAETAKHAADTKYQNGMIGRLEYLQAEVAYLTKKAAKEQADMALLQAVNDYEWTVKGL